MNKVICNQCVTQFICDVFSKKRLFLIKNHQSNKYNPLIYLYFIHAPTPIKTQGRKLLVKQFKDYSDYKELNFYEDDF